MNRYPGICHCCGKPVPAGTGKLEFTGGYYRGRRQKYILWCMPCFNASDNSGPEDRCCGNRAYEDRCAQACGFNEY